MSGAATATTEKRKLSFANEDEIISEIDRLRAAGYEKGGNWTLAMICYHIGAGTEPVLRPPANTTPTPEQVAMQNRFIEPILATAKPPPGMTPPPRMMPSETCGDADIEKLKATLAKLKAYPHSHVDFGPFGPVPIEVMRKLTLLHAAHHLGFLQPERAARREGLQFKSDDDVIAEVNRLRRGYTQAGAWSLPQVCYHLDKATQLRMQPGPFPPTTAEQAARREQLHNVLATGRLPEGLQAPSPMQPPPGCGDAAIDAFIVTLERFANFPGPIAPHRLFGQLIDADARRMNRIHCAHHLSHLTPTTT
jgi:hypothetical protein